MHPPHRLQRHPRLRVKTPPETAPEPNALATLRERRQEAIQGGGPERVARHKQQGKLTARERIAYLLDPGSFAETDAFALHQGTSRGLPQNPAPGDGVVTGYGTIHGRAVCVYAQDFTVSGGSLGSTTARKIAKIQEQAVQNGTPLLCLNDSGGARIQEGVAALGGYGDLFLSHVNASGVVPQISAILGPCAGGAVYGPALTDFIVATRKTSHMFLTGPDVVKAALGEETTAEVLGGADTHAEKSGVAHLTGDTDEETLDLVRQLLSYLPQNNLEDPPAAAVPDMPAVDPGLNDVVPADPRQAYDVRDVIDRIVDARSFLEIHSAWAENLVVGFARMDGRVVGIVANQPKNLAGVLDIAASEKGARFVRFCDAFNIPLVTLVDVPGFLPGTDQEHGGIIRKGAKLLYAYCEATVPKLTVILRKAYGGAYIVMASKHLKTDVNLAWPTAEIAVLGAEAAINILHRKDLANARDPEAERLELEARYRERFANPYYAAELGFVDDVVEPAETRKHLLFHLQRLQGKRDERAPRKHANMPL